jgi:hypothetical protein
VLVWGARGDDAIAVWIRDIEDTISTKSGTGPAGARDRHRHDLEDRTTSGGLLHLDSVLSVATAGRRSLTKPSQCNIAICQDAIRQPDVSLEL